MRDRLFRLRQYVLVAMAGFVFPLNGLLAFNANDTEPPNVVSFDFSPKHIDTENSSQSIIFTARFTDNLSGLTDGIIGGIGRSPTQARFQSPSGQIADVIFRPPGDLISGNELDGIYQSSLEVPHHSESGIWELQYLLLVDDVGNSQYLHLSEMSDMGFPTSFEVEESDESDSTPPQLINFSFEPHFINASITEQTITFTAHLTDDQSGITDGEVGGIGRSPTQVRFASPSGQLVDVLFKYPDELISGDGLNGIYQNTETLPQFSESGIWSLQWFLLVDDVGNSMYLYNEDLESPGLPTYFTVTEETFQNFLPIVVNTE